MASPTPPLPGAHHIFSTPCDWAQPPDQCVLAPSASDHKNFHSKVTIVGGPAAVNPGT